jgi:hypothetical protein
MSEEEEYARWFPNINPHRKYRQFYVVVIGDNEQIVGPYSFSEACAVRLFADADEAEIWTRRELREHSYWQNRPIPE